jgi:hypothetical protein
MSSVWWFMVIYTLLFVQRKCRARRVGKFLASAWFAIHSSLVISVVSQLEFCLC